MDFGKKYRVGNFTVLKYTKSLTKKELASLREDLPRDVRKTLQRNGVPYIKIEAVSGIWAIEFCCNTDMFRMIDVLLAGGGTEVDVTGLTHMFLMWFTDTCIRGDREYVEAKAQAMKAFLDRQKAAAVSDEADAEALKDVERDLDAHAVLAGMEKHIEEGGAS